MTFAPRWNSTSASASRQASTTDTWTHPYGVLTDGRIFIGLHQTRLADPGPDLRARGRRRLRKLARSSGHRARSPPHRRGHLQRAGISRSGWSGRAGARSAHLFARDSPPGGDVRCAATSSNTACQPRTSQTAREFWEPLGFVATEEPDAPYAHLPLTSDHLDLAFHRPRTLDRPMLVFRDPEMRTRLARIRALGVKETGELPRGLPPAANALLESPEGTPLLLLEGES